MLTWLLPASISGITAASSDIDAESILAERAYIGGREKPLLFKFKLTIL